MPLVTVELCRLVATVVDAFQATVEDTFVAEACFIVFMTTWMEAFKDVVGMEENPLPPNS